MQFRSDHSQVYPGFSATFHAVPYSKKNTSFISFYFLFDKRNLFQSKGQLKKLDKVARDHWLVLVHDLHVIYVGNM